MLSCIKASELIEKKINSKLSTKERIQLSMHTGMCDACRAWEKQSVDLEGTLANHVPSSSKIDSPAQMRLSDKVKKAILGKTQQE